MGHHCYRRGDANPSYIWLDLEMSERAKLVINNLHREKKHIMRKKAFSRGY